MFEIKHKKAFTLIELIVVMAVIGILVLLAIPKFMGYTKEARFTKLISNTKQIETASERYYMDSQDWPRLSDVPYTSDEIEVFSQKIYDATGKEANLDPKGKYYNIDFNKLSKYIYVPDDKSYYIIQNPVGNVYALEGLTEEAKTRLDSLKETSPIFDSQIFNHTGSVQQFIVPKSGVYKLELWGAKGADGYYSDTNYKTVGGNGGYAYGDINLTKGQILNIYVGGIGNKNVGGWNGGGNGWNGGSSNYAGGGGGASDIRLGGMELSNRIIVAGGGGGSDNGSTQKGKNTANGGAGGGLIGENGLADLFYTSNINSGGLGGTQTSGYSLGIGGSTTDVAGAGGGGGYYGGYASPSGQSGGGGGSSYIDGLENSATETGVNSGNGKVLISFIEK